MGRSLADLRATRRARFAPAVANNQPLGLQLSAIRARSLPAQVGLLDGDVIVRVNGFETSTPRGGPRRARQDAAAQRHARDVTLLDIEILRGGKPLTVSVVFE